MSYTEIVNNIFDKEQSLTEKAMQIFRLQYTCNEVYRSWNDNLHTDIASVSSLDKIPFLPISFFKTHKVVCRHFRPQAIFESSGTTGSVNSKHYVKDLKIYKRSFRDTFKMFYGDIQEWCIIALLPSYLERKNSSLVYMVDDFIKKSGNRQSGFYLNEFDKLKDTLIELESEQQKTLLIGVTFALLDFAENFPLQLRNTVVMETGGMKGRREEMTRDQVHAILCDRLGVRQVHSEYGMTELLTQAYSKGKGKFLCPPWMKVLIRDEDDPLVVKERGRGVLNVIDLANIATCSFIATDDVANVYDDGTFEILGRMDNSDLRGCSLMAV